MLLYTSIVCNFSAIISLVACEYLRVLVGGHRVLHAGTLSHLYLPIWQVPGVLAQWHRHDLYNVRYSYCTQLHLHVYVYSSAAIYHDHEPKSNYWVINTFFMSSLKVLHLMLKIRLQSVQQSLRNLIAKLRLTL